MCKQTQVTTHVVLLANASVKQEFSIIGLLHSFPFRGCFHVTLNRIFDVHDNHS